MTIYCIACGRVHIQQGEQVVVYDKDGLGLVTYHKDCGELAKSLTVEGLKARGYTNGDVAERIVDGITKGYGPKVLKTTFKVGGK